MHTAAVNSPPSFLNWLFFQKKEAVAQPASSVAAPAGEF